MSSEERHSFVVQLVEGACLNCFNNLRCVFISLKKIKGDQCCTMYVLCGPKLIVILLLAFRNR